MALAPNYYKRILSDMHASLLGGKTNLRKAKIQQEPKVPVYSYRRNTHYLFRETYEGGGSWRTNSNI